MGGMGGRYRHEIRVLVYNLPLCGRARSIEQQEVQKSEEEKERRIGICSECVSVSDTGTQRNSLFTKKVTSCAVIYLANLHPQSEAWVILHHALSMKRNYCLIENRRVMVFRGDDMLL